MRIGSLCSGIGGLELGLERAGLGTTVWQCEYDPHASEVLARHWDVPNHGDVKLTDWPKVEPVDVICAGFPCQPVSGAAPGRRKGIHDERWLFDDILAAVGGMDPRPGLLLFENVRGLFSANDGAAMGRVVYGLADLGYVGRYGLLRASDVGAPHRRERVFIVASDAAGEGRLPRRRPGEAVPEPSPVERPGRRTPRTVGGSARWGPFAPAVARWELLTRAAPAPTVNGRMTPAFVEWMMGFPPGWVDGLTRTAALRCLGNAVVPQCATLFGELIQQEPWWNEVASTAGQSSSSMRMSGPAALATEGSVA